MKHISPQSKSFILVLLFVLLSAYGAITLAKKYQAEFRPAESPTNEGVSPVATTDWKTYTDDSYLLSFQYPGDWSVSGSDTVPGFYVIAVRSRDNSEFRIYINDRNYFAMQGLKTEPITIGGKSGGKFGETIAAVKVAQYYYTFDATFAKQHQEEFKALLESVSFK